MKKSLLDFPVILFCKVTTDVLGVLGSWTGLMDSSPPGGADQTVFLLTGKTK